MLKVFKIIIALIQISGGMLLIYALWVRITESGIPNIIEVLLPLFIFIGISLVAGFRLLLNKPGGINLSIINFTSQIFQFSLFGFYWYYFIGPYFAFGYEKPFNSGYNFWLDHEYFTGTLILDMRNDTDSHFVLINLCAIIITAILLYLKTESKNTQIDSLQ